MKEIKHAAILFIPAFLVIIVVSLIISATIVPVRITNNGWNSNIKPATNISAKGTISVADDKIVITIHFRKDSQSITRTYTFNIADIIPYIAKEGVTHDVIQSMGNDIIQWNLEWHGKENTYVAVFDPIHNYTTAVLPVPEPGPTHDTRLDLFVLPGSYAVTPYIRFYPTINFTILNSTTAKVTVHIIGTVAIKEVIVNKPIDMGAAHDNMFIAPLSLKGETRIIAEKRLNMTVTLILHGSIVSFNKTVTILVPEQLACSQSYMDMLGKTVNILEKAGVPVSVKIVQNLSEASGYLIFFTDISAPVRYDNSSGVHVLSASSPKDAAYKITGCVPGTSVDWMYILTWYKSHTVFVGRSNGLTIIIVPKK